MVFIIKITLILVASAAVAFAINPFKPATTGCAKIAGISQLPLISVNKCDERDPCDIISEGAKCISTALDRYFYLKRPQDYPILTCSSTNCDAKNPPKGMDGVLQCKLSPFGGCCECPGKPTAAYSCGICGSPAGSTCFCCYSKT